MEIPKDKVIELLKERGDDEQTRLRQELPDAVDHEEHADLLENPKDLLGKVGLERGMPDIHIIPDGDRLERQAGERGCRLHPRHPGQGRSGRQGVAARQRRWRGFHPPRRR